MKSHVAAAKDFYYCNYIKRRTNNIGEMCRFFTLIACLAITGAVSDKTLDVKKGENVTLSVKTPKMRDVNRVTLSYKREENGTQVPIFRYCSKQEKKRGCAASDDDRFRLQLGSDNVSVMILDVSDAGKHTLEVIGNITIKETFNVVFTESSGGPSTTVSQQQDSNTVNIVVVMLVVIALIIVVTAVGVYVYKKKNQKKRGILDNTMDSEVADSQSSITGADEPNTDASSEEHCLIEMKPEDSTHPDAHNLNNNNDDDDNNNNNSSSNNNIIIINNNNNNNNNDNDDKDVIIYK